MKIAAFQAPLLSDGSKGAINLIREKVRECEASGADILCCPEGVLGGLADYAADPSGMALDVSAGQLEQMLAPLASRTVTTIVGFTEIDRGRFYNSAAVFYRSTVAGVYRKLFPAINRSIYTPGEAMPLFTVGGFTFGIVICRDSTFAEPAKVMTKNGARALFVPTNNGMPEGRSDLRIIEEARKGDIQRALENGIPVIRADVAGAASGLLSYGSSGVVDRFGEVVVTAPQLESALLFAEI